jgi:MerR family transcriptional regulator, copper efflux regulator
LTIKCKVLFVRISEAARRLGMSPRMLRYREDLGLLPPVREDGRIPYREPLQGPQNGAGQGSRRGSGRRPAHRQFSEADLSAVAAALQLERRYQISPASLAFGLRVLSEPAVRAAVADLSRRIGRIPEPPGRALDFEKERALRLLSAPSPQPRGPGTTHRHEAAHDRGERGPA